MRAGGRHSPSLVTSPGRTQARSTGISRSPLRVKAIAAGERPSSDWRRLLFSHLGCTDAGAAVDSAQVFSTSG